MEISYNKDFRIKMTNNIAPATSPNYKANIIQRVSDVWGGYFLPKLMSDLSAAYTQTFYFRTVWNYSDKCRHKLASDEDWSAVVHIFDYEGHTEVGTTQD